MTTREPARRLLLVGWDAADWRVIDKLLARGEMPHLAGLIAGGVRGTHATLSPPLSPMLWTSIATGKRPQRHGIHGFVEPTEDGLGVRPVSVLGRTTKAIWNILNQTGRRCLVVGWWPSHPAEPIAGAMVSDRYPLATGDTPDGPMPAGSVHPPALAERLAALRVHGIEVSAEMLALFVPEAGRVDQARDKSLHDLAGLIAETMSVHNAATELMATEAWDFAAVYYAGLDHFSHRFMRHHAGKARGGAGASDPALFRDVVVNAYRYHDLMLGRLLQLAGPEAAAIVASDHGFHSDSGLPDAIPAEAAGPAVEHRDVGILVMRGPGVRTGGERMHGASVLDVTPTVLHLFGLPAGADMDGKVLVNALDDPALPPRIPSWDAVPGADGRHPPDTRFDAEASVASLRQLVALGYVAPPGEDAARSVREALRENRYNLARAHLDAGERVEAQALLETLVEEAPEEFRFQRTLFACRLAAEDHAAAEALLDALDATAPEIARRSREALAQRRVEAPDESLTGESGRREVFERRALAERTDGFAAERMLMRCRLLLATGRAEDREAARPLLERFARRRRARRPLAVFLAEGFAALGETERAMALLRGARRADRDDWRALALEARLHHEAGRARPAAARAAASLALVYAQPAQHFILGVSLARLGDAARAEASLRVAVAQASGFVAAREALAALLRRDHVRGPDAAVAQAEAELARRRRLPGLEATAPEMETASVSGGAGVLARAPTGTADRAAMITVVTGLPRTGTSMMMQMLAAGGVAPFTDDARPADADNPRGYLEHAGVAALHRGAAWIAAARGRAVKVVAPLLPYLPPGETYRVVFMRRPLAEVLASQRAMLVRGSRAGTADTADEVLVRAYAGQLARAERWLAARAEIAVLPLDYDDVLADPAGTASSLAAFLGAPFEVVPAAMAVMPALRRQATGSLAAPL